jgi:sarcosine oxidase subunit gamma
VADIRLKPLTALGHEAPVEQTVGPWRMVERFDVALASLAPRRGRAADVARAADAAGLPLPGPAMWAGGAPYACFWLTPDMWMVEAPHATHEDIRAHLLAIFGEAASITEQTDAWMRLDLTGEGLARLFERLSNFDLAAAPDGAASRTVIEHVGCYLVKVGAGEIRLYGPRSSAESLFHAVTVAARAAA